MCPSPSRQGELTKNHFDHLAREWFKRAYNPEADFSTFPTGKVRQEVTIAEMQRLSVSKRAVDLGCGTGQLVIELLTRGYEAVGLDNAPSMIAEARRTLSKAFPMADPFKVFRVMDVLDPSLDEEFDVVAAMGLLEYLENESTLLDRVSEVLADRGFAFLECRNRLFNIVSGNQYTLEAASSGDLRELVAQLDRVERYSQIPLQDTWKMQKEVFNRIAESLTKSCSDVAAPVENPYPVGMVRKQHTPEEIEAFAGRAGLKLRHVIYYHCHPFLPRYERSFPAMFNRIAFAMQPLGYTPLGAAICSAFIAVVEK